MHDIQPNLAGYHIGRNDRMREHAYIVVTGNYLLKLQNFASTNFCDFCE